MNLKKGYFKENWMALLFVVIFLAASIYTRQVLLMIVSGLFAVIMGAKYRNFDEEERAYDKWWTSLSKDAKKKRYMAADEGEK